LLGAGYNFLFLHVLLAGAAGDLTARFHYLLVCNLKELGWLTLVIAGMDTNLY
jgi:hypothetical protein